MAVRGQARIKSRARLCAMDSTVANSNQQQANASCSLSANPNSCKAGVCSIDGDFSKALRISKERETDSN